MSHAPFKVNVSVVIVNDDKVLLLKRALDEDVFPGLWGIPGGTVEPNDKDLESALLRECMEEVGVRVINPILISNNINDKGDRGALYLVYIAEYDSGEPQALDGTDDVQWLTIDEIQKLELTPMTLEMIEKCL